jgi:hypothetical protein
MDNSFKIVERFSFAGVEVKVKDLKGLTAIFKSLGGKVEWQADKGAMLSFPSAAALETYKAEAKKRGSAFESASEWE